MKDLVILTAFAAIAAIKALPTADVPYVIVEKPSVGARRWREIENGKPDPDMLLPVRIGLTQSNLERGHEMLMQVSDPASSNYGKHFSAD